VTDRGPSDWREWSVRPPRPEPADALASLARRVERLSPDRCNPERFYFERGDITDELRRLARQVSR
jgi:hypothetical protein